MPKGIRRSGKVKTGVVGFGKFGTAAESTVYNSKGKAVSSDPSGKAARVMIGDKGIAEQKKKVQKAAKKVSKAKEGTRKVVSTSAKKKSAAKKK